MLTFALSMIQGPPRHVDPTNAIVIALVLGAVGLVFWASRPSVIARYSADRMKADESAEKENRA